MNTQQIIRLLMAFTMAFAVAACNDDDNGDPDDDDSVDTTPPEVQVERPEEQEVRTIHEGEDYSHMHFRATFTDNEELGEFEIDIHNNFDPHDHGKNFSPFHLQETHDITGTKDTFVDYDIELPAEAISGEYHLTLRVTDKAGNSLDIDGSDVKNRAFVIDNENFAPIWNINSPEQDEHFNHEDEIALQGTIDGNGVDVEEIWIEIIHDDTDEVVYEWSRDHLHTSTYSLERNILIAEDWPSGDYEIDIEVELENGLHYHIHPHLYIEIN